MKKYLVLVFVLLFLVSTVSRAYQIGEANISGDFRFRLTNSEVAGVNDSMTVPRARIKLSGNVTDDLSVVIQPDFGGLAGAVPAVMLADVYADLKCGTWMNKKYRFGQFLVPFAYNSGKYKTIIYPTHYNVIVPDRDFGFGILASTDGASSFISITNGNRSGADNNKAKDVAARIIVDTPAGELGLSGYYGRIGAAQTEQKDGGVYLKTKLNDVDLLAEYVFGGVWAPTPLVTRISNTYLQLSTRIDEYEPLIQYEMYDPNTGTPNNVVNTLTLGVSKYLADNGSRFMINYNIVGEETTQVANNNIVAQLRVILK